MALKPGSTRQLPDQGILDYYNKQTYLGNSFIASTGIIAGTGSEVPLMVLANPAANFNQNGQAGSLGCFHGLRKLQCDALGDAAIFNFYLNPTSVSGGSVITPLNLRPAWGTVSKMVVTKGPTISSGNYGTLFSTSIVNISEIDSSLLFVLDPGDSLLVTQSVSDANVVAEFSWYEI